MIEEQPGVEVVGEVHQQLDAAFADLIELALRGLTLVLLGAALALAAFDHHAALVDVQRLRIAARASNMRAEAFSGSIDFGAAYSCTCTQS